MSHDIPKIGTDGAPLPVMPPERDPRLTIRVIRVMFSTPGFLALLLLKAGEPTGFAITIEFLMLASISSIVAGMIIAIGATLTTFVARPHLGWVTLDPQPLLLAAVHPHVLRRETAERRDVARDEAVALTAIEP